MFADRFTYLAAVPFSILLAGGLGRVSACRNIVLSVIVLLTLVFAIQSRSYSILWNNDVDLWTHAVLKSKNSAIAHDNLGMALMGRGYLNGALVHLQRAAELSPGSAMIRHNLAIALVNSEKYDEAMIQWEQAFAVSKKDRERWKMALVRGWTLVRLGRFSEAEEDCSSLADNQNVTPELRMGALQMRAALRIQGGIPECAESDLRKLLQSPDLFGSHAKARDALKAIPKSPES